MSAINLNIKWGFSHGGSSLGRWRDHRVFLCSHPRENIPKKNYIGLLVGSVVGNGVGNGVGSGVGRGVGGEVGLPVVLLDQISNSQLCWCEMKQL